MPKLPLVSYSRIFCRPARVSHTLMRPSYVVLARYCPSSESAIAHISPALLPSSIGALVSAPDVRSGGGSTSCHTYNLALLTPLAFLHGPDFDFTAEAGAGGFLAVLARCDVVASELVGLGEGLREWEVGRGGCVDLEVGGTGCGDGLGGGGGEGVDVGWVGCGGLRLGVGRWGGAAYRCRWCGW